MAVSKKEARQQKILDIVRAQGTGVVSITDDQFIALLGGNISRKTISRDLSEMHERDIIVKDTRIIDSKAEGVKKQRDIQIKTEPQRRFTLQQHHNLSKLENHRVRQDISGEWIWERRPDGVSWERNMYMKEFESDKQIWSWIYPTISRHFKKATQGDRYSSRTGNNNN